MRNARTCVAVAALALTLPLGGLAQTPGTVTFRVTTSDPAGNYNGYVLAIWITDGSGTFIKTMKETSLSTRDRYLYAWIANSSKNIVDAITSATIKTTLTQTLTWGCTNLAGALVADGDYRIRCELTDQNGQGPITPVDHIRFTKGPAPVTMTPANSGPFSAMQLTFTPTFVPHDIALSRIEAPAGGVVGATLAVDVTVTNQTATAESDIGITLRNATTGATIGSQTVASLAGMAVATRTFSWDTTGLDAGDCTLEAEAVPVNGETDTGDNILRSVVTLREPSHDVAVTAVAAPAWTAPGTTPAVTVTVTNAGTFAESFTVTLTNLTDRTGIGSLPVTALAAGAAQNKVFTWNTAGRRAGPHLLMAEASSVPGEIVRGNNALRQWTAVATGAVSRTLVAMGGPWAYNDTGRDLHGTPWKEPAYYDGLWRTGAAELGYGDGDEATVLSSGGNPTNVYPCYYFRHAFVADAVPTSLAAGVVRDDGVVVYLNGHEALRGNMPAGDTAYAQWATADVGGSDETTVFAFTLDPRLVVPGRNVIAAELHQSGRSSTDISFNLSLTGDVPAWPAVPDAAVTAVRVAGTAAPGDRVPVTVTVANRGNVREGVTVSLTNLTAHAAIGTATLADLMPGDSAQTSFQWNTLGCAPGTHLLRAQAVGAAGDANPANDALTATGAVVSASLAADNLAAQGSLGGFCAAVAAAPGLAVVGEGASIAVVDISTPAAPVLSGRLALSGVVEGLALAGSHAYAACGAAGVFVIDLSQPLAPAYRATHDTPGDASAVAAAAGRLYVADGVGGLRVLDLSTPAAPRVIGTFPTVGPARAVAVSGDTAYVLDHHNGLLVLNVSDPASVTRLGSLPGLGFGQALAVSGSTLYAGTGDGDVVAIDVASPAAPARLGALRLAAPVRGLAVSGAVLYAAAGRAGLCAVNVAQPATPALLTSVPPADEVAGVALSGPAAFVTDGFAGLQVLSLAAPEAPAAAGRYDAVTRARGVVVSNGVAYVAGGVRGVAVYNVTNPAAPALLARATSASNACDVALAGALLYVADGAYGLEIVNVATPAAPAHAGRFTAPGLGSVRRVGALDASAVLTDGHAVVRVSAAAPANPVATATYAPPGYAFDLTCAGGYVFLAAGRAGLVVLDAHTPGTLVYAGALPLDGLCTAVRVKGTLAHIAAAGRGWHTVDISRPAAPALVGMVSDTVTAIAPDQKRVVTAGTRLQVFDVSTPLTPVPLTSLGRLARAARLFAEGSVVYASQDDAGVAMVPIGPDLDADGLPDAWEQQIVDADPTDPIRSIADVLPGDDFDRDGLPNAQELAAGTSPTDSRSVFAVAAVALAGDAAQFVIRWYSTDGHRYSVRRAETLASGFAVVQGGLQATPPTNVYTAAVDTATGYFLITIDPP
jgi:hypothetical protein